jgi:hypothetical protein
VPRRRRNTAPVAIGGVNFTGGWPVITLEVIFMKALTLILVGALAVASVPAEAHGFGRARIGVGLGLGYSYPYGWYDPWFYPYPYWYEPYPSRPAQEQAKENLFVYPTKGQSDAQTAQDRKECNDWAVDQSGLDPATAKRRAKTQHQDEYNRAFTACMEGRDYSVE